MTKLSALFAILVLVFAVAAVATDKTAKESPETITLADCQAKKTPVDFPHAKHQKTLACKVCHHTQETLKGDTDEVVKPCRACHVKPEKADTPKCSQMSATKNPFHIRCVGCHKQEIAKDATKKLPVKCEDCHKKKALTPAAPREPAGAPASFRTTALEPPS